MDKEELKIRRQHQKTYESYKKYLKNGKCKILYEYYKINEKKLKEYEKSLKLIQWECDNIFLEIKYHWNVETNQEVIRSITMY